MTSILSQEVFYMLFEKILLLGLAYILFRIALSNRGHIKLFGFGISWRR